MINLIQRLLTWPRRRFLRKRISLYSKAALVAYAVGDSEKFDYFASLSEKAIQERKRLERSYE